MATSTSTASITAAAAATAGAGSALAAATRSTPLPTTSPFFAPVTGRCFPMFIFVSRLSQQHSKTAVSKQFVDTANNTTVKLLYQPSLIYKKQHNDSSQKLQ